MNNENRPDPDTLLDLVNHDRSVSSRGRLKVFFGASAGVGKTYAMLLEAHRKLAEGIDVVIGVVETHGRVETIELTVGIPSIPTRTVHHRGVNLQEFDLEAALERKPSLILIDEFAHTNAPRSRHPKRWQDVEELLSHGIDVYTTLNVQHLESINDMVAKLTGILVRETVPDSIFDASDDIALIDIPSDELLKRLYEGKVYIAEGANKRAAENFFKKSNLVALRELALRRTAERVDAENDVLTASQGQKETQLGQKILVCVGHDGLSSRVIRHAKRMATRAKSSWYALYVETGRHERLNEKAKLLVDRNLRLAEKMGARIIHIAGGNAADEILNYARDNGFTRIVVGHKKSGRTKNFFRGTLYSDLINNGTGFEITTVTEDFISEVSSYNSIWKQYFGKPAHYLSGLEILGIATLIGLPFRGIIEPYNLTILYIISVIITAAKCGTGPAILTSFLSVFAFCFFYTEPFYTFQSIDFNYYYSFVVMLVSSIVVGSLASQLSLQARQSRKRASETSRFYALTRELSAVRGTHNMAEIAIKHIKDSFNMEAVVFLNEKNRLILIPDNITAQELKEESVAYWVLQNGQIAGRNTDTLPSAKGLYIPLTTEGETFGVLGLIPALIDYEFTSNETNQLETFASLMASAFGRARRADQAESAKVESEREKLRNILLSSVSHDLRTPLASITGSASAALIHKDTLPQEVNQSLESIHYQASLLAKLITNLLDATSLETGLVRLNKQPHSIQDVIHAALNRVIHMKKQRSIDIKISQELPMFHIDGLLIEQVLINLLDNAIRYTPEDGNIIITAEKNADTLRICVSDNGKGILDGDEDKIFKKFYTHEATAEGNAGLGLAICMGIVTAHGGMIFAKNNKQGGASFTFTLPEPKINMVN